MCWLSLTYDRQQMGNKEITASSYEVIKDIFPCNAIVFVLFLLIHTVAFWHVTHMDVTLFSFDKQEENCHMTKRAFYICGITICSYTSYLNTYCTSWQEEQEATETGSGTGCPLSRQPHSDDWARVRRSLQSCQLHLWHNYVKVA